MKASEVRDLDSLRALVSQGGQARYLCFWGHRLLPEGRVGKSCLSQWYPAPFDIGGVRYPTAEHFMMAEKARLFGDAEIRSQILAAADPAAAKAMGRKIGDFDSATWERHRLEIVVRANVGKFGANPDLKRFLLGTGEAVLVEASPVDSIWGIGLAADHADARNPLAWRGLNLLGFALMEARTRLAGASR